MGLTGLAFSRTTAASAAGAVDLEGRDGGRGRSLLVEPYLPTRRCGQFVARAEQRGPEEGDPAGHCRGKLKMAFAHTRRARATTSPKFRHREEGRRRLGDHRRESVLLGAEARGQVSSSRQHEKGLSLFLVDKKSAK
jgi:hypothetical protein